MEICVLLENTSRTDRYRTEHGLSLYLEPDGHRLLFDTGASDCFLHNAALLDIDISKVDLAILSHGHADHGGGLGCFLSQNRQAAIYLQRYAFAPCYAVSDDGRPAYDGLDPALLPRRDWIFTDDLRQIGDNLSLFAGVTGRTCFPASNDRLKVRQADGTLIPDDFRHEQNLIVTDDAGQLILLTGCAHNGILNILDRFISITGRAPDIVVGGFHLDAPGSREQEDQTLIREVGRRLQALPSLYFTCHCTGVRVCQELKTILGDRITYVATGDRIDTVQRTVRPG